MASDSFENHSGVPWRDQRGLSLLGCAATTALPSQMLQQPAHPSDGKYWFLMSLQEMDLVQNLFSLFLASPMQIPCRLAYIVPHKLNMWVSHLEIRLRDSRNDPLASKSHAVLHQLRRMSHGHSHRLILKELLGSSATVQDISPWLAPPLDTTFLWSHWERQRHIRRISARQMNVYTQWNAIHSATFAANPAALNEALLPSPSGSVIERS